MSQKMKHAIAITFHWLSIRLPCVYQQCTFFILQNHKIDFDETCCIWNTYGPLLVLFLFGQYL